MQLYSDCKGNCEEANRHLVSCVKCRQILNYEFNIQLSKLQRNWNLKKL